MSENTTAKAKASGAAKTKRKAKDVALAYKVEYDKLKGLRDDVKALIDSAQATFRAFTKENGYYNSRFLWLSNSGYLDFTDVLGDSVYFFIDNEDYYIKFSELDNFKRVLNAEYKAVMVERAAEDEKFKEAKRARLAAELAALDSE